MIVSSASAGSAKAKRRLVEPAFVKLGAGPELLAILLDARGAKSGEAVLVDRILPGEELLDGQRVARAGFLEGEQAAAHGSHDFRLAADDPAFGSRSRQIRNRERTS